MALNGAPASKLSYSCKIRTKAHLRQGKGIQSGTHDHDVLLAVAPDISHRICMSFRIQLCLPEHFPGPGFKRAEALIVSARDKDQTSRRCDRTSLPKRTRIVKSFRFHFIARSKRHSPGDVAGARRHSHQLSPGRLLARQLLRRVPESGVHRSRSQWTEAPVCHLIAIARLVHPAHAGHVARINKHIAEPGIDRDAAVVRTALLAGKDDPEFFAAVWRIRHLRCECRRFLRRDRGKISHVPARL